MTTTINASNSGGGGLVQTADASGVLALQTAGVTAVTVDASQNVGIGTSSPSFPLTVVTSSSALGIAINGRSSDNFGSMYFYANNGSTQHATITASASEFRFSSVPAAAVQTFYTNASERMRIDSSGNLQFNSGYGSVAVAYGCRAWVNFNGSGTVAIRASGNVSSITDNGAGNYSVNFATAMPDANYAPVMSVEESGITCFAAFNNTVQQTAGVGRIGVFLGTGSSGYDADQVNYVVLR